MSSLEVDTRLRPPPWAAEVYDSNCRRCPLHDGVKSVCIPGRGNHNAVMMLVAEAPGGTEDAIGLPLVGPSGKLLSECLAEAGIDENDVFVSNAVRCQPPDNRDPGDEELMACSAYLAQEIERIKPRVIVPMGRTATRLLTQQNDVSIGRMRGNPRGAQLGDFAVTIIPTWHPAYALRQPSAKGEIVVDLRVAKRTAYPEEARKTDYRWMNDPNQLVQWTDWILGMHRAVKLPHGALSFDTESTDRIGLNKERTEIVRGEPEPFNPKTNIGCIQFSWALGKAVVIPIVRKDSVFNNPFTIKVLRDQIKRLFDEVPFVAHNAKYDCTVTHVKLGLVPKKVVFCTMMGHIYLQRGRGLPNTLEYMTESILGWPSHKRIAEHLLKLPDEERCIANMSPEELTAYGGGDADSTLQLYPEIVKRLQAYDYREERSLGAQVMYANLFEAFQKNVMYRFRATMLMEFRGSHLEAARFPVVSGGLLAEIKSQEKIVYETPFHKQWLENTKEENSKRNKPVKKSKYIAKCTGCALERTIDPPKPKSNRCMVCATDTVVYTRKMLPTGETVLNAEEPEWIYKPLNMASPQQMTQFVYRVMCLPSPTGTKHAREGKLSVDDDSRKELMEYCAKENLQLHLAVIKAYEEFQKVSKLHSAYAKSLPEFVYIKSEDDYNKDTVTAPYEAKTGVNIVHPNYKQLGTMTGRPSTVQPALSTIPRPREDGEDSVIKTLFTSRFPNGLIVQADLSQAEIRALVVLSGDDGLRGVFERGEDAHRNTASRVYGVPIEKVTKHQRQDVKPIVFGLIYGRGPVAIAAETGKPVNEMKKMIDAWMASAPKVGKFIQDQHSFADRIHKVVTIFGRVREIEEMYATGNKALLVHAHNVAVNHPVQGMVGELCLDAHARVTYRMEDEGFESMVVNTVYDSIICDTKPRELLRLYPLLVEEVSAKLPKLFPFLTLPFTVDIEVGYSWGELCSLKVPEPGVIELSGSPTKVNGTAQRIMADAKFSVKNAGLIRDDRGQVTKMKVLLAAAS